MWGCDVWVAHTHTHMHVDTKPVARHQKLRRYLYDARSLLETILDQAENHMKGLTPPPTPPRPYRQRALTLAAAAPASAEFTGSYNQGQQKPQMKMASRSRLARSKGDGYMCRPLQPPRVPSLLRPPSSKTAAASGSPDSLKVSGINGK